jgi:hypothetical protein
MSWVVHHPLHYVGHGAKGSGECAALPIALNSSIPKHVAHWKRGALVKNNFGLTPGTVIAVFNSNSDYQGSQFAATKDPVTKQSFGVAHTALYVTQTSEGIEVVHQNQTPHLITRSFVFFGGGGPKKPANKQGYYDVGKSKSGTTLQWREKTSDPKYHWGVSGTLHRLEDDANNYHVVELKPKHSATPNPEDFAVHVSGPTAPNL